MCIQRLVLFGVRQLLLPSIIITAAARASDMAGDGDIEKGAELKALRIHRLDNMVLLMFTMLLVVAVLTVWLFKHHRFRFVHESSLTLLYGLLVGVILRFVNFDSLQLSQTVDVIPANVTELRDGAPPDYVRLALNETQVKFHYELLEGLYGDKNGQNERQIQQKMAFSPEIFFNIILPPIIFNAGYGLKKRHFFRNIGSIMTFVFLGTLISCLVIGFLMYAVCWMIQLEFSLQELLFFGALISATDPVTVLTIFSDMGVSSDLFALVFGESVMNDAMALVMAGTIDQYIPSETTTASFDFAALINAVLNFFYVFFGSLLLGAFVGCVNALVTKFTKIHEFPLLETSLFLLMSYTSFLLAEVVELTGVVAVLFCGICQAHYTFNNLSEESQVRTKQFFEVSNFLLESFIFSYIGVSMIYSQNQKWNFLFVIAAVITVVVARAAHIYPLSYLLNLRRTPKISRKDQHMMLFSGLRGAMAFALASRNTSTDQRQIIYTTTSVIVIATVVVNGGLTAWLVDRLQIGHHSNDVDDEQIQFQLARDTDNDDFRSSTTSDHDATIVQSGQNPWDKSFLPRKWYNFDANFMKPLLTHATPSLMQTMPALCMPISKLLTSTRQRNTLALDQPNLGRSGSSDQHLVDGDSIYRVCLDLLVQDLDLYFREGSFKRTRAGRRLFFFSTQGAFHIHKKQ